MREALVVNDGAARNRGTLVERYPHPLTEHNDSQKAYDQLHRELTHVVEISSGDDNGYSWRA